MYDILLVEDNPDDEILTLRALSKNHVRNAIRVARDGEEAINILFPEETTQDDQNRLPGLILLDLKLPKLSGIEVLRRIRADDRTRLIPVVILTSSDEKEDLIEGYMNGANSYIWKPVDFDQFLFVIEQLGIYWLQVNRYPEQLSNSS